MSNPTKPVLSLRAHDQVVLGAVECRDLEHATSLQLESELAAALDAAPGASLVLDLSRVEFVPSLALGILVKVHKALAQKGQKCVLVGVAPRVQEAMSVTGLTRLLVLRPTTAEALQCM